MIATPVLYVLSVGPACWTASALDRPPVDIEAFTKLLKVIYAPLLFAAERMHWFSVALDWYIDLLV